VLLRVARRTEGRARCEILTFLRQRGVTLPLDSKLVSTSALSGFSARGGATTISVICIFKCNRGLRVRVLLRVVRRKEGRARCEILTLLREHV